MKPTSNGLLAVTDWIRLKLEPLLEWLYDAREAGVRRANFNRHRGDPKWWDRERNQPRTTWWAR